MILEPLRRRLGRAQARDPGARDMRRREAMVGAVEAEVRATRDYLGKERLDPRVIAALGRVPREEFLPPTLRDRAYENLPLPIGQGQTISQPYIVAVMTDMLAPRPEDRLLEIGTGCGYQAALLAELVAKVYSIEFLPALAVEAAERLRRLGHGNVELRQGDGALGWPEEAPFDGIIVTAAAARIPPALVTQLKPGRRLVLPVGEPGETQDLVIVEKDEAGLTSERVTLPVAFVPLV